MPAFAFANQQFKQKQQKNFDRRHRVCEQSKDRKSGSPTTDNHPSNGRVVTSAGTPRSYVVETPNGEVRRNRSHLNIVPDHANDRPEEDDTPANDSPEEEDTPKNSATDRPGPTQRRIMTRSQTGTAIVPPNYL